MSDALVNGLAGACGGIIAQILTYPLQAVNTRQQVRRRLLRPAECDGKDCDRPASLAGASRETADAHQQEENRNEGSAIAPNSAEGSRGRTVAAQERTGANGRPRQEDVATSIGKGNSAGMADTAREMLDIVRTEGVRGLYQGLEPSLVGTACSQGVYYYFYQIFRDHAVLMTEQRKAKGHGSGQVGMVESLIVAALAGCVNVMLTNPIWVIVTRMQTQSNAAAAAPLMKPTDDSSESHKDGASAEAPSRSASWKEQKAVIPPRRMGALATTWELFEEAGILGFWKGVLPTLMMVSNPAIQFTIYETLLARLTANRPRARGGAKSASAWEIFLIGALAKLGATVVTYPLLVVKARLQAKSTDQSAKYSGTLNALVRIVMEEGLTGLYKGMETKIVQSVFAASVLFLTKEELVKFARVLVERREKLMLLQKAAGSSVQLVR